MAKKSALVFGIIFLIVGILGFIPNGLISETGVFHADTVHNIVHLITGLVLIIVAAKSASKSATVLIWIGIIYLVVTILGFIWDSVLGLFMVNTADNWLHLVLGVVITALGFAGKKGGAPMTSPSEPMSSSTPQM